MIFITITFICLKLVTINVYVYLELADTLYILMFFKSPGFIKENNILAVGLFVIYTTFECRTQNSK